VGNSRDFIKSSRVILIDRRGSGLSDRFRDAPTQETMLRDLEIVLDAAGSAKATLFGMWDGCETSTLFAATFPERVASLIFFTASAAPIDRLTQRHVDRYLQRQGVGERFGGREPNTWRRGSFVPRADPRRDPERGIGSRAR